MALAIPVKESNKQDDISVSDLERDPHDISTTTRQEPEAMFFGKRTGEISRRRIRFPRNRLFPHDMEAAVGVWLSFTMSIGMTSNFCEEVKIINQSDRLIRITMWAISETLNDRNYATPMIGQTITLGRYSTAYLTSRLPVQRSINARQLLESVSGQLVMVVVQKIYGGICG